jgi:hypothetical protein
MSKLHLADGRRCQWITWPSFVLRGAELIEGDFPRHGLEEADNLLSLAREVVRINIEVLQDTLTLLLQHR